MTNLKLLKQKKKKWGFLKLEIGPDYWLGTQIQMIKSNFSENFEKKHFREKYFFWPSKVKNINFNIGSKSCNGSNFQDSGFSENGQKSQRRKKSLKLVLGLQKFTKRLEIIITMV
jgi:hypothetical protein